MKITINIPTGEIYPPKAGDCYQGVVGKKTRTGIVPAHGQLVLTKEER